MTRGAPKRPRSSLPRPSAAVLRELARRLPAPNLTLLVPGSARNLVYEFSLRRGRFASNTAALMGSWGPTTPLQPDRRKSGQAISLGFGEPVEGVLLIEGGNRPLPPRLAAGLGAALGSGLAPILDYLRRPTEPASVSRRLAMLRDLCARVIGLTNRREIAAIVAQFVSHHLADQSARVILVDRDSVEFVVASAGETASRFPEPELV